ncbi:MAG: PEP-CTERM sorting domain-containing protein [Verrucomicrobia bacterium]|nr:PEP-CTERM sorting domain-containing protein [Verrucomicrobiota bacterium]
MTTRKIAFLVAACFACLKLNAQGTLLFNNFVPGVVDGRFTWPSGSGFGADWTAQLFLVPSVFERTLIPLFPTTTFKTGSKAELGYVFPVVVAVPDFAPGEKVLVEMRATLDQCVARSGFVNVSLGGGDLPPAPLVGLSSISFIGGTCIPEPSTVLLSLIGGGVLFWRHIRRKRDGPETHHPG